MIGRQFRVFHETISDFTVYTCRRGYLDNEVYLVNNNNIIYNISHLVDKLTEQNIAEYILKLDCNSDCNDVTTWEGNQFYGKKIAR